MTNIAELADRGVITLAGGDRVAFLQGLVSNDVAMAAPGRAVFAALLTPQGRWLADFFVFSDGERLFLEGAAAQLPDLLSKLARYRLRMDVALTPAAPALRVYVAWHGAPPPLPAEALFAPDPRHAQAGTRILSPVSLPTNASAEDWDAHRLGLGLPDGPRDLEAGKTLLLEARYDELDAISWTKGCYMGQELTARTRYRGLVKRRLVAVGVEGPCPPLGAPILAAGACVGEIRTGRDGAALAWLPNPPPAGPLLCGAATLTPRTDQPKE
jgi:folate-binding protein YgfZ